MPQRVSITISDTDEGFRKLKRRISRPAFVDVGLFETDPPEVVMRAFINEFGDFISNIPERSFFRAAIDENMREVVRFIRGIELKVILGLSTEEGLKRVGAFARNLIKKKMEQGPFKPNAPLTIAKKGFDKPLFETFEMYERLKFRVGVQV